MKKCTSCGEVKSLDDFQVRKASKDGRTAACRECLKQRDKARYGKEKVMRAERHKQYMTTEAGKAAHSGATARWKERNRLRRAAQVLLNNAVRDGRVKKLPCWVCGSADVEGHHPDYSAPLDVVWLCTEHHKEIHLNNPR